MPALVSDAASCSPRVPSVASRQPVRKTVLGAGSFSGDSSPPRDAASQSNAMATGLMTRCQRRRCGWPRRRGAGATAGVAPDASTAGVLIPGIVLVIATPR
jgi:hypothetical protein